MLDKKTFAIGILSLSAVILLVANLFAPRQAAATYETIENNDYSIVTATSPMGGDALYITDKRSGKMGVFTYNPNRKGMDVVDVQPIQNVFQKALKK